MAKLYNDASNLQHHGERDDAPELLLGPMHAPRLPGVQRTICIIISKMVFIICSFCYRIVTSFDVDHDDA